MATAIPTAGSGVRRRAPLALRIGFWVAIAIAVAVVVRRLAALLWPTTGAPPDMQNLDAQFAAHAALTVAHIVPALAFVLLLPFALLRRFGGMHWPARLLYPLGVLVGLTAYAMSGHAVGGWIERSAVLFFNSVFLFSLGKAYLLRRAGDEAQQRRWLLRAVVVLLGIATTRPVMAVFFATQKMSHLRPDQFFGVAFWIGFSINFVVIEWWLRRRCDGG